MSKYDPNFSPITEEMSKQASARTNVFFNNPSFLLDSQGEEQFCLDSRRAPLHQLTVQRLIQDGLVNEDLSPKPQRSDGLSALSYKRNQSTAEEDTKKEDKRARSLVHQKQLKSNSPSPVSSQAIGTLQQVNLSQNVIKKKKKKGPNLVQEKPFVVEINPQSKPLLEYNSLQDENLKGFFTGKKLKHIKKMERLLGRLPPKPKDLVPSEEQGDIPLDEQPIEQRNKTPTEFHLEQRKSNNNINASNTQTADIDNEYNPQKNRVQMPTSNVSRKLSSSGSGQQPSIVVPITTVTAPKIINKSIDFQAKKQQIDQQTGFEGYLIIQNHTKPYIQKHPDIPPLSLNALVSGNSSVLPRISLKSVQNQQKQSPFQQQQHINKYTKDNPTSLSISINKRNPQQNKQRSHAASLHCVPVSPLGQLEANSFSYKHTIPEIQPISTNILPKTTKSLPGNGIAFFSQDQLNSQINKSLISQQSQMIPLENICIDPKYSTANGRQELKITKNIHGINNSQQQQYTQSSRYTSTVSKEQFSSFIGEFKKKLSSLPQPQQANLNYTYDYS